VNAVAARMKMSATLTYVNARAPMRDMLRVYCEDRMRPPGSTPGSLHQPSRASEGRVYHRRVQDSGPPPEPRGLGRCLVTGAGGFIGSHVVEALCERGCDVRAMVRYTSHGGRGWLAHLDDSLAREVEVVHGDITDPDQMRSFVDGCESVFHLAALIGIPYSYASPRQNLEVNAAGTLNLLEAARASGVSRFVHTSSSEVYGSAQYVPIDEDHPLVGQSPYSASKIAADQVVASYMWSFELPAVIVRPFNTFGPRQSMRAVIPTIISQALWSDRIRLGSLETTRDFTFVRDTAAGLVQAAATPGIEGGVYNLGFGSDISVGDLAQLIRELAGSDAPVERDDSRVRPSASEVDRLCSDSSRARAAFGWEPRYSLREGLTLTIDWIRSQGAQERVEEFTV
jgi:NAD dependent epimerase/dehydratase